MVEMLKCLNQLKSVLSFLDFGRCSSELAEMFLSSFSRGRFTRYFDGLHDSSVIIPICYKDFYANSFFPGTPRLRNSLLTECFLLSYDLNGFMSRIIRHLVTIGPF